MNTRMPVRILLVAGALALFISYLGVWIRFISDPVERTGADFIAFYSAGRVAQTEGSGQVYDITLQQDVQEAEVGFELAPGQVLLYNHLPFLIPILQLIMSADYVGSFHRWVSILIALYVTSLLILDSALKHAGVELTRRVLAGIGGMLFLPLFFSLMNGQDTAFLFLGTALWTYGLHSRRDVLAGLGLSLTTVRPHIALMLALPMFFRHRRAFWFFALGSGMLAILSFTIIGVEGTLQFIRILFVSAGGEWHGMQEDAMYNLIGLLARAAPWLELGTVRTLGWGGYALAIAGASILWATSRRLQDGRIGLTVIAALFAVPHLHFHDLTLLLIPMFEMMRSDREATRQDISLPFVLPIAASLLLLASNAAAALQFSVPYLIMLILAAAPYYLRSGPRLTEPRRS